MIYVCEHHDEVLDLWRRQDLNGIRLAHVDFHDDMRGLYVDRRRARAWALGALARGEAALDAGNFLAHAVLERRLDQIHWIHDTPGGRAWDLGIVRYESDLLGRRHRRSRGGPGVPLIFAETLLAQWSGPEPGQRLSVDWDCFACLQIDPGEIGSRVERFFERLGSATPADTYVAYSPEYSHPTLDRFGGFLQRLAERLDQPLSWLTPGLEQGQLHLSPCDPNPDHGPLRRMILFLRRRGIY